MPYQITLPLCAEAIPCNPRFLRRRLLARIETKLEDPGAQAATRLRLLTYLYAERGHRRKVRGRIWVKRVTLPEPGKPPLELYRRTGRYAQRIAAGHTYAELAAHLAATPPATAPARPRYERRQRRVNGHYVVTRRGAHGLVILHETSDRADASRLITDNTAELDARWKRWHQVPPMRPATSARSTPDDRLAVTPAEFEARLALRGVQFGNYVEQHRRERGLAATLEAFEILATIVGWPLERLSLGGDLAIAFGARGRGGRDAAAAHYEPGNRVIDLTKRAGPGSIAHEWFHALDHALANLDGAGRTAFASERNPHATGLQGSVSHPRNEGPRQRTRSLTTRAERGYATLMETAMTDKTTTLSAAGIIVTIQLALFAWLKTDIGNLSEQIESVERRVAAVEREVAFVKGQLSLALPSLATTTPTTPQRE